MINRITLNGAYMAHPKTLNFSWRGQYLSIAQNEHIKLIRTYPRLIQLREHVQET